MSLLLQDIISHLPASLDKVTGTLLDPCFQALWQWLGSYCKVFLRFDTVEAPPKFEVGKGTGRNQEPLELMSVKLDSRPLFIYD
jgi:hypothetical protein